MLTILSVSGSGVSTLRTDSSSDQLSLRDLKASSTSAGCNHRLITGRTRALSITWDPGGSNFAPAGFSEYPSTKTTSRVCDGASESLT